MSTLMKLESILDNIPQEVISVSSGDLLLGRDAENSVVIDEVAISRVHANIFEVAGYWFFRDLNSTNGSAINGVKMTPDRIRILRNGDVVHLATYPLRFVEITTKVIGNDEGSLLVFLEGGFQCELNFNSSSSKFSVGGKGADYVLDGLPAGSVALEFHFHANEPSLKVIMVDNSLSYALNGVQPENNKSAIYDRDEISINNYKLIVNCPVIKSSPQDPNLINPPHPTKLMEDWEQKQNLASATSSGRFVFTATKEEIGVTDTVTMKSNDLMLGVNQVGLSQRLGATTKASEKMKQRQEEDEEFLEKEQKEVHYGLWVLLVSTISVIVIIALLTT